MENTNNINYWNKIKLKKPNQHITFIHTPKCGGRFVHSIINNMTSIRYKGHIIADPINDGITFTIIRNPIERFESLMNYRLGQSFPRRDWPQSLHYVYRDKSINLNNIVEKMSDNEIINFKPYKNLYFWSKNIDIFITIDKLEEFLSFFGYNIDIKKFKKKNVSIKNRGKFNEDTKNRISNIYAQDMLFFKSVILD